MSLYFFFPSRFYSLRILPSVKTLETESLTSIDNLNTFLKRKRSNTKSFRMEIFFKKTFVGK